MKQILQLIKKDVFVDWRQQHPISGILLYLVSTIFASYMAFEGIMPHQVWNAIFWLIMLFAAINAMAKSFIQEDRRNMYYFFLATPDKIMTAKLIYSFVYLTILSLLSLWSYSILFGNIVSDVFFFGINLLLGCLGLSSSFTMVSAIAFKTNNQAVMMAILGFPVIMPVLVLSIGNSNKILEGKIWMQIRGDMLTLLSVDIIIIVLAFVLFPFAWRS